MRATEVLTAGSRFQATVIGSQTMSCEIVTSAEGLRELEPEWRRLNNGGLHGTIFQQWDWVAAYCRAYHGQFAPRVAVVNFEGRVIGILPLQQKGEVLEILGTPEADYGDILCEEGYETEVLSLALQTILTPPFRWKRGVLKEIAAYSLIARHFRALPGSVRKHAQLLYHCPSPVIRLDGEDRGDVIDGLMKQEHLKRYDRKMQRSGVFVFRHLESREEARAHLAHFFDQHICRNAMLGRKSRFQERAARDYFEALIDQCDLESVLRFSVIEVDGKPITYHLGFLLNGMLTYYSSSFDVNQTDNSPGRALLRNLFAYCKDADVREFDFSIGDESYKFHYANQVRDNFVLHLDPHPSRPLHRAGAAGRFVAAEIQRRPGIKKNAKQVLNRIAALVAKPASAAAESKPQTLIDVPLNTEMAPADLGDLARMAAELPLLPDGDRLLEAKRRIKRGDRAFISRDFRNQTVIYWAEKSPEPTKKKGKPAVEAPAIPTEFYECWPAELLGCEKVHLSWMKRWNLSA
jgi:CelD/BcsL family acetyltransferase involved in cellulose biosynthesis